MHCNPTPARRLIPSGPPRCSVCQVTIAPAEPWHALCDDCDRAVTAARNGRAALHRALLRGLNRRPPGASA